MDCNAPHDPTRDVPCFTPAEPDGGPDAAASTPPDGEPISDLDHGLYDAYAAALDDEDHAVGRALRARRRTDES